MINKESRIIVTGFNGQLGFDIVKKLLKEGFLNVKGIDINDLDITKKEDVVKYFDKNKPDLIIHCAAFTNVDKAEIEKDACYNVNVIGTQNLVDVCKTYNSTFVYFSTDYVFDGLGNKFFEVNDKKDPLSVYGKTKSLGEDGVLKNLTKFFIIRISWVFGINGNNFIKTMINLSKKVKEINVVDDQIGSPTYTVDIANLIFDMIQTEKYGIYHATNENICSWYEFSKFIFKIANIYETVNPVSTEKYSQNVKNYANRPLNSRLSKKSLVENGFNLLPTWEDATIRFLKEFL